MMSAVWKDWWVIAAAVAVAVQEVAQDTNDFYYFASAYFLFSFEKSKGTLKTYTSVDPNYYA